MITNVNDYKGGPFRRMNGLSTDSKPTIVANGSEFFEMDTGSTYMFDEEGAVWDEQPAEGGASIEALSVNANGTYTAPSGAAYSPVTVSIPVYDGTVEVE